MKLSAVQVKQAKLPDGKGLYLLMKPAGKYWRLDYRFDGKRKTLALGTYPDVSLAKARAKAQEVRALLADGIDPAGRAAREVVHLRSGCPRVAEQAIVYTQA